MNDVIFTNINNLDDLLNIDSASRNLEIFLKDPLNIEEAKLLPKPPSIETIFSDEYPSKPEGHNWPRSYEQYKNQVGGLQEDMDAVYDMLDEYEEIINELRKDIKDLERRKRDK